MRKPKRRCAKKWVFNCHPASNSTPQIMLTVYSVLVCIFLCSCAHIGHPSLLLPVLPPFFFLSIFLPFLFPSPFFSLSPLFFPFFLFLLYVLLSISTCNQVFHIQKKSRSSVKRGHILVTGSNVQFFRCI